MLLLFASEDTNGEYRAGCYDGDASIEAATVTPFGQCINTNSDVQYSLAGNLGEALISVASSPYIRSAPLILFFLSSTALVVGVILTQRELRRCLSWMQTCQEYGEEYSEQLMRVMGVSKSDEVTLKESLCEKAAQCIDGLVIDDLLQKWVKMGVELSMGVFGGIFLYSLPEETFVNSVNDAKGTRRRLIHAADPSLEQIIFRPGGVWGVIPSCLRESLAGGLAKEIKSGDKLVTGDGNHEGMESASVGSNNTEEPTDDDDTNNDGYSSDTPLSSPAASVDVGNLSQNQTPVQFARDSHRAKGSDGRILSQHNVVGGSRETIADALSATINDLISSNFTSNRKPSVEDGCNDRGHKQGGPHQGEQYRRDQRNEPHPSPPMQLEKTLQCLTAVASFMFLYHLRSSPSTRRAWGSAAKFLTSLGLVSTAIGAGVTSTVLSSNEAVLGAMASNPIVGMLYSKMIDSLRVTQLYKLPTVIGDRAQLMLKWLREEIKKNKRLQAAVAFTVLYGIRRLSAGPRPRQNKFRRR